MLSEVLSYHDYVYYAFLGLAGLALVWGFYQFGSSTSISSENRGCVFLVATLLFGGAALAWNYVFIPEKSYWVEVITSRDNGIFADPTRAYNGVEYEFPSGKVIEIPRPAGVEDDPPTPSTVIINALSEEIWIKEITNLGSDSYGEKTLYTLTPQSAKTVPFRIEGSHSVQATHKDDQYFTDDKRNEIIWLERHTNILVVTEVDGKINVDYQVKTAGENFVFEDGSNLNFDIPENTNRVLINNSPYTLSLYRINYRDERVSNVGGGDVLLLELAPMTSGSFRGIRIDFLGPKQPPGVITLSGPSIDATRKWLTWDKENQD